ncbi:MAG: sulfatase-like hydrolase/transferase [Clostridia bacterium]|nr:sulfatase-like hydrolase/transferase [Clostridia bacterium]
MSLCGDNPRFLYCLTIQNYGEYTSNGEEYDIVHLNDTNKLTNELNEFLSCIYLSDKDLPNLLNYFETCDRDVIVAMCGDHAPAIDFDKTINEYDLKIRTVPFIIWSNKKKLINKNIDGKKMSMIYFLPSILETANMPMSKYYNFLIKLRNNIPIITKYGKNYDNEYNAFDYEDKQEYKKLLDMYFNLEYSNVLEKEVSGFFVNNE